MTELIEHISDLIEGEVDGAEGYVMDSVLYKEMSPTTAKIFYEIANDELRHVNLLHGEVVRLIAEYRNEHGEPPADMLAIYGYLHKKMIKAVNAIKMLQQQY